MTYTDGVATLEISPSEPSDANGYRIEAKNKMGEVSSKATLIVNGNYFLSVFQLHSLYYKSYNAHYLLLLSVTRKIVSLQQNRQLPMMTSSRTQSRSRLELKLSLTLRYLEFQRQNLPGHLRTKTWVLTRTCIQRPSLPMEKSPSSLQRDPMLGNTS